MLRRFLLWCGIASSLFYVGINIVLPPLYPGYSVADQTVSELFAIGAPTRAIWIPLAAVYSLLVMAFALGVWLSAGRNRPLAVSAFLIAAAAGAHLYWPPVHMRGEGLSFTDVLHQIWALATLVFILLAVGFGARALGREFRRYSRMTLIAIAAFTALTVVQGVRYLYGLPTPWIGVWERAAIALFLLWIMVLAVKLLGRERCRGQGVTSR